MSAVSSDLGEYSLNATALIGLTFSGSNIQVIKDKTGAFVYVDKENVPAQYAGKCIIRGNSVQVSLRLQKSGLNRSVGSSRGEASPGAISSPG